MQSQTNSIKRLSTEELRSKFVEKLCSEGRKDMGGLIHEASIEYASSEERRREAQKPLYIVRYE